MLLLTLFGLATGLLAVYVLDWIIDSDNNGVEVFLYSCVFLITGMGAVAFVFGEREA